MFHLLRTKYLEHARAIEIQRTGTTFPTSACRAINVTTIEAVGAHERRAIRSLGGEEWTLGHLHWPQCGLITPPPLTHGNNAPIAVLITLDRNYVSVILRWSRLVRQAEMTCVVGTFDPEPERVCVVARAAKCQCEISKFMASGRVDESWAIDAPRRVGVRARFELAHRILPRFHGGLIMHDADVAFGSLEPFASYARWARRSGYDLVVQPNGRRKEAFDNLNFGLVWFASATFCTQLLGCLLDSWEHPAFQPTPRDPPVLGGAYRERSQPRLTHLLELVRAAAPSRAAARASSSSSSKQEPSPRLCRFPAEMRRFYAHATIGNSNSSSAAGKLKSLAQMSSGWPATAAMAADDVTDAMEAICTQRARPHQDGCEAGLGIVAPPLPSPSALAEAARLRSQQQQQQQQQGQAEEQAHLERLLVREKALLLSASVRASLRFSALTAKETYRNAGVFFSEALALIGALEATGATHFIESGTASGVSTELIATYFADAAASQPLNITTIDRDQLYHLFEQTSSRLHGRFPNVRCLRADSMVMIPQLLDSLPDGARALVFVDGPKGKLGLRLVETALAHPRVVLAALHDAAPMWGAELHARMRRHPEHVMHTSDPAYRAAFGAVDTQHDEQRVLEASPRTGPAATNLPEMLKGGPGLWLAGRTKLRNGGGGNGGGGEPLHVALGADRRQIVGLLAGLRSLLRHATEPRRLQVYVVALPSEAAEVMRAVACVAAEVGGGASVSVVSAEEPKGAGGAGGSVDGGANGGGDGRRFGVALSHGIDLARFHLPQLLPAHVRKVLWLDADVLVLADVGALLDSAFRGPQAAKAIGAVVRRKPLRASLNLTKAEVSALGLRLGGGATLFNAGVLLLNLEQWRRRQLTSKLEALATKMASRGYAGMPGLSLPTDSQSVLALHFQGGGGGGGGGGGDGSDIEWLPAPWNVDGLGWKLGQLSEAALHNARMLHWSGGDKPWQAPTGSCHWALLRGRVCGSARDQRLRALWREHGGEPSRCAA